MPIMETPEAKMFVRSLNNSAAKILIAFTLARSALDVQELVDWTGMGRDTISKALNSLKEIGKVDHQVLAHNRHVWLPSGDLLPGFRQLSEKSTTELQMSGFPTSALGGGGDSINLINIDSPLPPQNQLSEKSTTEPTQESGVFPSAVEILRHTEKLFDGSVVVSRGLEHCIPQEVLAWCAYAYYQFNRQRLDRPAGLVRRRLLDGERASEKMRGSWKNILPDEFLEAVGLVEYECPVVGCDQCFEQRVKLDEHRLAAHPLPHLCEYCRDEFVSKELLQAHVDDEHTQAIPVSMETDESVTVPIHGGMNAERAWQSVLGQLQMEMPRASFDTWVKHSRPVSFTGNTLTIGVRNSYARDWLESRLASTVSRLLVGILNQSVTVAFVVAQLESPDA